VNREPNRIRLKSARTSRFVELHLLTRSLVEWPSERECQVQPFLDAQLDELGRSKRRARKRTAAALWMLQCQDNIELGLDGAWSSRKGAKGLLLEGRERERRREREREDGDYWSTTQGDNRPGLNDNVKVK
jgi:hypothetical protein